ncbi:MAG: substrate-binding domain-containing protein [Alphaproteobacteria bacterium]|jgi:LacI family transcriptional regulator|nr:substrate-binding domain-containing protein [Alphaproteobacteria bacterium]
MSRPTIRDIADAAGVSLATVDRVLNERPGVRTTTIERVQAAIDRLGYTRDLSAANLARQREYRFVFALPDDSSQFVETLCAALQETAEAQIAERVSLRVLRIPITDPHEVVRRLDRLDPDAVDGIAIMAPETPQVRDAVGRLKATGMPVVTVVSDLPNSDRDHFVGINNHAAGRTAGVLMGRFVGPRPAEVLVVATTLQARDSLERRLGFDEVMAEDFPRLRVLPTLESHGDPARMAAILATAFSARPGIAGVYSLGAGVQPMLDTLRRLGRLDDLVVIAHELTPATRTALAAREIDAVITQTVGHLIRSALRVLKAKCDRTRIFEAQERIRIEIVLRENLP